MNKQQDKPTTYPISYWERESFTRYDHIIIGGGITGLSTAAAIAEQAPEASVLVLERGLFPSGASTKNAGFACFGSITELLVDRDTMGAQKALALVNERWSGLQKLRDRLGDAAIGFQPLGGYELLPDSRQDALDQLDTINDWLRPLFEQQVFSLASEKLKDFRFDAVSWPHMVFNPLEGHLHTGQMMRALLRYVQERGVTVLTGTQVSRFEEEESHVTVLVDTPFGESRFLANKLAVCTNAFSKQLLPGLNLEPGRGQVLVTKPMKDIPFRGTFHFDEGYFYFRDAGDRIIFGGGRNHDYEAEKTASFGDNQKLLDLLRWHMDHTILPGRDWEEDMHWSGIMAFGPDKEPILERHSERICLGIRLGGMGVAIGSRLGEKLAAIML